MFQRILADAFGGFTPQDIPFLTIQLTSSAIIALVIRFFWLRETPGAEEEWLTRYLVVLQVVLTLIAVFALRSPWLAVLFGFFLLVLASAGEKLSIRSRILFLLCSGAAWGCGAGNLAVTGSVYVFLVFPLLYFATPKR